MRSRSSSGPAQQLRPRLVHREHHDTSPCSAERLTTLPVSLLGVQFESRSRRFRRVRFRVVGSLGIAARFKAKRTDMGSAMRDLWPGKQDIARLERLAVKSAAFGIAVDMTRYAGIAEVARCLQIDRETKSEGASSRTHYSSRRLILREQAVRQRGMTIASLAFSEVLKGKAAEHDASSIDVGAHDIARCSLSEHGRTRKGSASARSNLTASSSVGCGWYP